MGRTTDKGSRLTVRPRPPHLRWTDRCVSYLLWHICPFVLSFLLLASVLLFSGYSVCICSFFLSIYDVVTPCPWWGGGGQHLDMCTVHHRTTLTPADTDFMNGVAFSSLTTQIATFTHWYRATCLAEWHINRGATSRRKLQNPERRPWAGNWTRDLLFVRPYRPLHDILDDMIFSFFLVELFPVFSVSFISVKL